MDFNKYNPLTKIKQKREEQEQRKILEKQLLEAQKEVQQKLLDEVLEKKAQAEQKLTELQANLTALRKSSASEIESKIEALGGIDSSEIGVKQFRLDKIRKQAIEVEVKDGERSIFTTAKIVDKYYLEYKVGRKKTKIIIVTQPENFERTILPLIWIRRGIQYTHIKGEAYTHDPYISSFDLIQVKMILGITEAVSDAKMYEEIARAAKGKDKKELLMWMIFSGVIAVVAILASGDYFK